MDTLGYTGCSSLDLNSWLVTQTVYIDLKLFSKLYSYSFEFFIVLYRLILKHIVELLMPSFVDTQKIFSVF